jgi:hypothetical protein
MGQTMAEIRSALDVAATNLARAYPETNRNRRFIVVPLHDQMVGASSATVRIALAGALLILVIACANLATLFLGDLPARRRDFALRAALGATRARLFRQLALEGVLLSAVGGAAGLVGARAIVAALKQATTLPRAEAVRFDAPVTFAMIGVAVLAGAASRLVPALQQLHGRRHDLRASISAYSVGAPTLRRVLVLVQLWRVGGGRWTIAAAGGSIRGNVSSRRRRCRADGRTAGGRLADGHVGLLPSPRHSRAGRPRLHRV